MQLYGSKTTRAFPADGEHRRRLKPSLCPQEQRGATSYLPVDIKELFASIMARMKAAKPEIEKEHANLLSARYDLSNRAAKDVVMS